MHTVNQRQNKKVATKISVGTLTPPRTQTSPTRVFGVGGGWSNNVFREIMWPILMKYARFNIEMALRDAVVSGLFWGNFYCARLS